MLFPSGHWQLLPTFSFLSASDYLGFPGMAPFTLQTWVPAPPHPPKVVQCENDGLLREALDHAFLLEHQVHSLLLTQIPVVFPKPYSYMAETPTWEGSFTLFMFLDGRSRDPHMWQSNYSRELVSRTRGVGFCVCCPCLQSLHFEFHLGPWTLLPEGSLSGRQLLGFPTYETAPPGTPAHLPGSK